MTKRTYREMMAELQALLADMQAADVDVDEAISKFERGQTLVMELESYLQSAKNKVEHHTMQVAEEIR